MSTAIALHDVTVAYTKGGYTVTPIDGLTTDIDRGSLVLLLGPSGCGKTTLLSCLAGILAPTSGAITVEGKEITSLRGGELTEYRRNGVGIVFQGFNLIPSLDAVENVAMPLRAAGRRGTEARARATELLHEVGLGERLHHRPGDLSGGQQQRVAIARALALDPPLVVADEPTANLDHLQVETVLRLLRSLTERGRTVVVSTHDHRLLPLADRVLDLSGQHGASLGGTTERTFADGEVLFRQGERGEHIVEVVQGTVRLVRDGAGGSPVLLDTAGPGAIFGEMAPLFGLPRSATAIAVGDTSVVLRTVDDFRAVHGAARLRSLVGRYAAVDD